MAGPADEIASLIFTDFQGREERPGSLKIDSECAVRNSFMR